MNLKVYRRTRYQNIYQHIKNKNYVIMISKPVKTSISTINGEKIWKIEDAIKIRDNSKIKLQKNAEIKYKGKFDDLWNKYIDNCTFVKKLAFNTIKKKRNLYNKHLKEKIDKPLSKLDKEFFSQFVEDLDTTIKEKNEILRQLKTFFNWCINEQYLIANPIIHIEHYKTSKTEMKYWTPDEFMEYIEYLNHIIENTSNLKIKEVVYRTKMLTIIGFILGDRIGETRALKWHNFDKQQLEVSISHSINYDPNDDDFLKTTKTYSSQRKIDITDKFIIEIENYKHFLIHEMEYNIKDTDLIFFNYTTNRPFSDTTLRKHFYQYIENAGLRKIRIYDLRHSFATTMMTEGKDPYAFSIRMGHKSIKTTIDEYGHLSKKLRREVAEITDKFI